MVAGAGVPGREPGGGVAGRAHPTPRTDAQVPPGREYTHTRTRTSGSTDDHVLFHPGPECTHSSIPQNTHTHTDTHTHTHTHTPDFT